MELRKIAVDSLSLPEILSLLEIARGLSQMRPDWNQLKGELTRYDAWGFYENQELFGYALVNPSSAYFGGSVQLAALRYSWQYNRESVIGQMICRLAGAYREASELMVMDIDIRHDLNLGLYKKLGFSNSLMRSPLDRDHAVLVSGLDSLLKNRFDT